MPKPRYWGVEPNRNRHGRLRWYFRPDRAKPRIRLPDDYGSPEFELAYRAAVAGDPMPSSQSLARQGRRSSRGSLGWLVSLYLASPAFLGNRASTQRPRRTMLEKLAVSKGQVDIEDITRSVIQDSMNARRETVHMANAWLTTVSNMFDWATKEDQPDPLTGKSVPILEENPCALVKRFQAPKKDDLDEESGHPTFSDKDLATFEAAYPEGTLERRAYATFLYTGFRVGDGARVGRQHVQRDGTIKIKTEKTGTEVCIAIVPPLQRALAAGPQGPPEVLNFLTTSRGKAWDKNYLGWWFGDRCRAIGLDRSAHGLRKASARRFAERGATVPQLMAIFGWKTPSIAMHYVEMANRKKMALDAQGAMDWDEIENRISPTLDLGGGTGV
jgi:hypothetical protein